MKTFFCSRLALCQRLSSFTWAILWACLLPASLQAGVDVELDLTRKRSIGNVSTLDRKAYLITHNKFRHGPPSVDNYFMYTLNTYPGRDSWHFRYTQFPEDPARPGYVDPSFFDRPLSNSRSYIAAKQEAPELKMLLYFAEMPAFMEETACQGQPDDGLPWTLGRNGTPRNYLAAAELMANVFKNYQRFAGHYPKYLEVWNEPDVPKNWCWQWWDPRAWNKLASFHVTVATTVRASVPDVQVGGPTICCPRFSRQDFETDWTSWYGGFQKFAQSAGPYMDFFSVHLYDDRDFTESAGSLQGDDSMMGGARAEATLDLIENYSQLAFGQVKKLVISEYGTGQLKKNGSTITITTEEKEWKTMSSVSGILMSLLERPDRLLKSVPFILASDLHLDGYPFSAFRNGEETHLTKFYKLWKNVKGHRLFTTSSSPSVVARGFIDGADTYLVMYNMGPSTQAVNVIPRYESEITTRGMTISRLYFNGSSPFLIEDQMVTNLSSVTLNVEETAILKLQLTAAPLLSTTVGERFYYGDRTVVPIEADQAESFSIHVPADEGPIQSARLRVGFGQSPNGFSSNPTFVKLNGTTINGFNLTPTAGARNYFGLTETTVPVANVVTGTNSVTIQFGSSGGHISSVVLVVGRTMVWPNAISTLSGMVAGADPDKIQLSWISPGDDGARGSLPSGSEYRIQYTTVARYAQDGSYWDYNNAQVIVSTTGALSGTMQGYLVTAFPEPASYYFRIWTTDNFSWSPISNGATVWAGKSR